MTIRWAIAGPGAQATVMAEEFAHAGDGIELMAVGARPEDHGEAFAERFGLRLMDYDKLFAAEDVDVVYLATPHAFHTDLALRAIEAGKALVVEKSFTTTLTDTQRIIDAARECDVFCMEAMWTRFLPAYDTLRRLMSDGVLGEVRSVQGDLTAHRDFDDRNRLFNAAMGGGAMLDLGVYCLHMATDLLGLPERLAVTGGTMPNGVDGEAGMLLGYPNGRFATLGISFKTYGPGRMAVMGTEAWVDIPPRFHRMDKLVLYRPGTEAQQIDCPRVGLGYSYELRHVSECLRLGLTESPLMPLTETLEVQKLMQQALESLRN
ncbi:MULTISPECIES: Gfo/Idh/MocA family protein [unclassified Luteococcus]|uniref:Gfo/Idh/MocA family protein n=1 Tax=unclassified Luteococcus TaxID=2639923 RepID=UPI00313D5B04